MQIFHTYSFASEQFESIVILYTRSHQRVMQNISAVAYTFVRHQLSFIQMSFTKSFPVRHLCFGACTHHLGGLFLRTIDKNSYTIKLD